MLEATRELIAQFDKAFGQEGTAKANTINHVKQLLTARSSEETDADITLRKIIEALVAWLQGKRPHLVSTVLANAQRRALIHNNPRLVLLADWYQIVWRLHRCSVDSQVTSIKLQHIINSLQVIQRHAQNCRATTHQGLALSLAAECCLWDNQVAEAVEAATASTNVLKGLVDADDPRIALRLITNVTLLRATPGDKLTTDFGKLLYYPGELLAT